MVVNYKYNHTMGDKNICWYCGHQERCTKDHFYPQCLGGKLKVYACCLCQGSKGRKTPIEWLQYLDSHEAVNPKVASKIRKVVTALWSQIAASIDKNEVDELKRKIYMPGKNPGPNKTYKAFV
jgi:hypothetical protein